MTKLGLVIGVVTEGAVASQPMINTGYGRYLSLFSQSTRQKKAEGRRIQRSRGSTCQKSEEAGLGLACKFVVA